jgi:YD repeat-containing protein
VVRQVDRTFNRFHLLTEEKSTQDHCVQLQKTLYYAEDKPFAQQPAQFQLPRQTTRSWLMDNDASKYREEITLSAFDVHGNQIEEVEPNGVRTVHTYYPKEASDGCPADPQGFVRNRKDSTTFPSTQEQPGAPTLHTRLRYLLLPALNGSGQAPWLSSESETLQQRVGSNDVELQQTLYAYHNQPGAAFLHGRPASQRTTLNGLTSTTEYAYRTLDSVLAGEVILETIETLTGFDHGADPVRKVTTREDSLVHGQPLLSYDDNGVKIRSTYDELQRVTSETVSPDDDEFKATRSYSYYLTSLDGQQAQQQVTDVKNVTTRTYFDGLNRPISEERQNADSLTRADEYRATWSAQYDALQNLIEETQFDWRGEEQVPLTRTFDYDAWGMQCCVTGPDGVQVHEQTDPIGVVGWKGPIQRSWLQGPGAEAKKSGTTVTYVNLFEKPAHIERFDTKGVSYSLHQYGYDGLGQTVLEIDARDARTEYAYDSFGRMIRNTLPGGAVVERRYALHSADDLPIEISVDGKVLGTQEFDGLGRMKASTTGGRRQVFSYLPGLMQPDTVTTASQQRIHYEYNPQLSEEPMRRQLPGEIAADYVYDKQNARLLSCQEQALSISRQYFSTGELKSEQRDQQGESHAMHYDYSRQGLLLSYTDVLQQVQTYDYDVAGRLVSTQLGSTQSDFSYDDLGQTKTITTEDSASKQKVAIALEYDDFGREILRAFDLDGIQQQLTQAYNAADLLQRRTLKEGDELLREETYEYDPRGRLTLYTCEGSQPPVDPYGKAIARQVFRFDAMDNLTQVLTTPADGSTPNRATYRFENPLDPTQLSRVENSAGAPYPAEIVLEYDADGHLIRDEELRVLEYDALGRLTHISGLSGEPGSNLDYDPLDTLVGKDGPEGHEQRFYREGELANRIQGADGSTFVRAAGMVLAEHQTGGGQTPS